MTTIILLFVILNVVAGEYSWRGQKLELNPHPLLMRARWLAFGLASALLVIGHDIAADDWLSWITVLLLAFGVVRLPSRATRAKRFKHS